MDYQSSLDTIRNMTVHDKMETSGSRAVWPEVLAVYAVKVNTDPNGADEFAVLDDGTAGHECVKCRTKLFSIFSDIFLKYVEKPV